MRAHATRIACRWPSLPLHVVSFGRTKTAGDSAGWKPARATTLAARWYRSSVAETMSPTSGVALQLMALQFDGSQAQHTFGSDPLLFGVPAHLLTPLPLLFSDLFEKATTDRNRQADACIPFVQIEPGDGQGLGAAERIRRREHCASPMSQQKGAGSPRSCQCNPFGKR